MAGKTPGARHCVSFLGESKRKDVRYLDIHEDDQLDEALVTNWIRQASELPGWAS